MHHTAVSQRQDYALKSGLHQSLTEGLYAKSRLSQFIGLDNQKTWDTEDKNCFNIIQQQEAYAALVNVYLLFTASKATLLQAMTRNHKISADWYNGLSKWLFYIYKQTKRKAFIFSVKTP